MSELPERAAYVLALLEECERLADEFPPLLARWSWWRPWSWPRILVASSRNLRQRQSLLAEIRRVMDEAPEVPL